MNKFLNKGRNVINIEEVQTSLDTYAKKKKLSLDITQWLQKSFLRWVINHFVQVQVVKSLERYKVLIRGEVPSWFTPNTSKIDFIYIDIKHHQFQDILEKCTEFLSSRDEKLVAKFPRMTVEQVLKKWDDEHLQMMNRSRVYKETSLEGLEKVFTFESMHVVKLKAKHKELSLEMARESALMQHCLGEFDNDELGEGGYGAYYFNLIRKDELELYSIRDEKNMPHVSIALYQKEGILYLDQIKGKQNRPPIERYVDVCVEFFNALGVNYNYHSDTLGMGVVYLNGKSQRIKEIEDEDTQQFLVAYDKTLIHLLPNPSKATLWLAVLQAPMQVEQLHTMLSDEMRISALLQKSILMLKVKLSWKTTPKNILKGIERYSIKGRVFKFLKLEIGRV